MTAPFNRVIEAVAAIATKLGATVGNTGNRLADNLEGIANADIGGGGGSGGVTIVHDVNETLDMTAGAILAAAQTGPVIVVAADEGTVYAASPVAAGFGKGVFYVETIIGDTYTASNENDYPSIGGENYGEN